MGRAGLLPAGESEYPPLFCSRYPKRAGQSARQLLSSAGFAPRLYAFLYAEPGARRRDANPLLRKYATFPAVRRERDLPASGRDLYGS